MKQKTHSGAKKRFRVTGSTSDPKIVGRKAAARHLLFGKAKRQKKLALTPHIMKAGDAKVIKKLLHI
ncbi:MAG: hypothetical protein ACD_28C00115G0006 [uncultured bacterium]|nr:MAG: hypothetical protein ACD_28C00115G0006 [uncultured bacterium]